MKFNHAKSENKLIKYVDKTVRFYRTSLTHLKKLSLKQYLTKHEIKARIYGIKFVAHNRILLADSTENIINNDLNTKR